MPTYWVVSLIDQMEPKVHKETVSLNLIKWVKMLAWGTIGFNVLEGIISMAFGVAEGSISLIGFGADSFIEVGSAFVILWRFKEEQGELHLSEAREKKATKTIGLLFLILAVLTAGASVLQLASLSHPESTWPGVVISAISLSLMFFLWSFKKKVAQLLSSPAAMSDAACTLACIKLSAVLFAGSILFVIAPNLWWADGVGALILSAFIGREGREMLQEGNCQSCTG